VLGTFGPTGAFPEERASVSVAWEGGFRIGEEVVTVPMLAAPFRWTIVPAGFVVAAAADSQRLWIVESAA
jgi:hypothetical protein